MSQYVVISLVIILMLLFSRLKWRISTLSLVYYMEKNRYKLPNEKEMKECTEFVVKNTIKDLTGH